MNKIRPIFLAALFWGIANSALAHPETALAGHAHLATHLVEASVLGMILLAVFTCRRVWSKNPR